MSCCGSDIWLTEAGENGLSIQVQLTSECPNSCKHCYNRPGSRERIPLERCKKIMADFKETSQALNRKGRIIFTGGDPLMYPFFFEVLEYTRSEMPDIQIQMLGNPELLTDEVACRLKELNVNAYQMSLDGLEDTHDYIRHKGSFRDTLKKVAVLKSHDIRVVIRATVSGLNIDEIPGLFDLMNERGIDIFSIHRFVPVNIRRYNERLSLIPPKEYKSFLLRMYDRNLRHNGHRCGVNVKEPLWKLLESEMGLKECSNWFYTPCIVGDRFAILQNGDVLVCRMLPIPIGKVPEQRIIDIINSSPILNKMNNREQIEECGLCEFRQSCGGCRALAYCIYGSYFAPDPYCWRTGLLRTEEYSIPGAAAQK